MHDAFGRGLKGAGFRAQREEPACHTPLRRVTGEAVDAITADTRWPNPWLNDGPHGERNCASAVEDAVFADQKAGLMPEWAWSEARADDMPRQSAARQADAERVELRKRLSVLQSLGKCLG